MGYSISGYKFIEKEHIIKNISILFRYLLNAEPKQVYFK